MWLSKRQKEQAKRPLARPRAAMAGFAACLILLSACGFQPVYGPGAPALGLRDQITIAAPSDEEGFALVRRLEERLGTASGPYELRAEILITEDAVGILTDGTITRYNVQGAVPWQLMAGEQVLTSGREDSFTSYSATSTTVATIFAQRDARSRLMVILADRIVAELLRTAPDWTP